MIGVETWSWVAIVVVLVALGIATSVALARRRRSVWRDFARVHGLRCRRFGRKMSVEGTIDDRPFVLGVLDRGSDSGELGVEEIGMGLGFRGWPEGLRLQSAPGLVGAVHRSMVPEHFDVGDEDFDAAALLAGGDPPRAREYLTPERRACILRLLEGRQVVIAHGQVSVHERSLLSRADRLEEHLEALREVTSCLDRPSAA